MENSTAVALNPTPDLVKQEAMTQPTTTKSPPPSHLSLCSRDNRADVLAPTTSNWGLAARMDVGPGGQLSSNNMDDGYFDAILGAVIAAVVLVLLCLAVVVIRYMYRYKGTYHTNEAKGTEFAETADAALRGDPALQDAMDESKKEYFI
ncbi:glycophorin-C isoform X1 [Esox lucius]|uniref:glycophorin-C isoform X1 n=1 Tax=Esox lucius TaxID=8010 RepID=UPI000973395D|nr:glycophorin-C isoform X1 [Esox lucius]XP_019910559.1 glycophorin-C isoform X1 [Esox lucius]